MRDPRALLAAGLCIVAVVLAVVLLPRVSDGPAAESDKPPRVVRAKLTLEQFTRPDTNERELLVSLPETHLNRLDLTRGEPVVRLRCMDRGEAVVISRPVDWPLLEEYGFAPHTHQPAGERLLNSIRSCRLTGPGIDFQGLVPGRLPTAQ